MYKLWITSVAVALAAGSAAAATETAPGARPANTTSSAADSGVKGKKIKVKPAAVTTDPSAPMATTAPVSKDGSVPPRLRSANGGQ